MKKKSNLIALTAKVSDASDLPLHQKFLLAVEASKNDNISEASQLCAQIISTDNSHHPAFNLLALIALRSNQLKLALESINNAIYLSPENSAYLFTRGSILFEAGTFDEAENSLRKAIELNPQLDSALDLLGTTLLTLEKNAEAIAFYRKASELASDNKDYLSHLSYALLLNGEYELARREAEKVIALDRNYIEAHINLARIFSITGQLQLAADSYDNALLIEPKSLTTILEYAQTLQNYNETDAAQSVVGQAISNMPTNSQLYLKLCDILQSGGHLQEALEAIHVALLLDSNSDDAWYLFTQLVRRNSGLLRISATLLKNLEQFLQKDEMDPEPIFPTIMSIIGNQYEIADLLSISKSENDVQLAEKLAIPRYISALYSTFICQLIAKTRLLDYGFEIMFTAIRRVLLQLCIQGEKLPFSQENHNEEFLFSLANYCFFTEYVMKVTDTEENQVTSLEKDLIENLNEIYKDSSNNFLRTMQSSLSNKLMIYACYKPLSSLPIETEQLELSRSENASGLWLLLKNQVLDTHREKILRQSIPKITDIVDHVSNQVREQYEENPYPRWQNKIIIRPTSVPQFLILNFPQVQSLLTDWPKETQILVAGCGSGKQPIEIARSHPDARVLAVDLSLTSLAYAERRRQELNISNLSFAQADILKMGSLDNHFDIIHCTGVLHHMENPQVGWEILTRLLKKNGFMRIGLYSKAARKAIVSARKFISKKHFQPTPKDIRRCRAEIIALPNNHPAHKVSKLWSDFYTLSTCRDLLFHTQEHHFDLLQIEEILKQLQLEFIGFALPSGEYAQQYKTMFPQDTWLTNLKNWNDFEKIHTLTFKGMYQFWLYKA
jgi:Flp pilus assembly protein TadD/2-polyprenyl-3-methyl-5-hydroxy-6-metoxy-1,4-benzoquinol methylase